MSMSTPIPHGITTPDDIQTRLGALHFFNGVPDEDTVAKVCNLVDYNQALQAFIEGTKIASTGTIRKGILDRIRVRGQISHSASGILGPGAGRILFYVFTGRWSPGSKRPGSLVRSSC